MLVLKGQGAACRSPRGVGANAGASWDSGQLLVEPGEASVLVIQPWEGWARQGCHPVLSTQVENDGGRGATLEIGPLQADSATDTQGWAREQAGSQPLFSPHLGPVWPHAQRAWVLHGPLMPRGVEDREWEQAAPTSPPGPACSVSPVRPGSSPCWPCPCSLTVFTPQHLISSRS